MNIQMPRSANQGIQATEVDTLKNALKTMEGTSPEVQLKIENDTFTQLSESDTIIGETSRLTLNTLRKVQAKASTAQRANLGEQAMKTMISCGASCSASFVMGALGNTILDSIKDIQNPADYVLPILQNSGPAGSPDYQVIPDTLTRILKEVKMSPSERKDLLEAAGDSLEKSSAIGGLQWFGLRVRATVKEYPAVKIASEAIAAQSDRPGDAELLNFGMALAEKIRAGEGLPEFSTLAGNARESMAVKLMGCLMESVAMNRSSVSSPDDVLIGGARQVMAFGADSGDPAQPFGDPMGKGLLGSAVLDGITPLLQNPVSREILNFGKEMADLATSLGHPEINGKIADRLIKGDYDSGIRDLPHQKKILLLTFDPVNETGILYDCDGNKDVIRPMINEVLSQIAGQEEDPAAAEEARVGCIRLQNLSLASESDFRELKDVFTRVMNADKIREKALDELQHAGESHGNVVDVDDDYLTIDGISLPRVRRRLF